MEATAKYEFFATADDELSFRKGEQLKILATNDDWLKAEFAGNEGLVPKNYIDFHLPSWYQEDASRTEAQERLIQQPPGSFLIRGSQSSPGDFSISVRHSAIGDVQHFKVLRNSMGQYHLWSEKFPSLNQLVDYYKANSISMHDRLLLLEMAVEQQGRAPRSNLPPVPVPRAQPQPPQPKAPPMQQMKATPMQQVKAPSMQQLKALQLKAPPIQQVKAPPMQQVKAPPMQQVKAPPMQQVKAPSMQQVKAPSMQQLKALQLKAPPMQQVKAPPMQQVKAPLMQQPKAPLMQQLKALQLKAPPTQQVKAPPMQQVKALYPFNAEEKDELNFNAGDIIEVLDRSDGKSWWKGRLQGRTGLFPSNYTTPV